MSWDAIGICGILCMAAYIAVDHIARLMRTAERQRSAILAELDRIASKQDTIARNTAHLLPEVKGQLSRSVLDDLAKMVSEREAS